MADVNVKPAPAAPVLGLPAGTCKTRTWVFIYNLAVIALLALIAVAYINGWFKIPEEPKPLKISLHAMWFGSIGGIVISLKGVYDHSCAHGDWDDGFCLWHVGRPISGAITGLITMVLLQAVNPGQELTQPVVYTVAFVFGTQERRFFNFLSQAAALVVTVPNEDQDKTLKATGIEPSKGKPGTLVIISGQGFEPGAAVTFGSANVDSVAVSKDGKTIAGVAPAGTGTVDVAVSNPGGARFVVADKFTYTA